MSRMNERGMTLIELMVVVVLGGLILGAMYEVLISNQRTYAAQNANSQAQQTLQGGMSVLFGELREISPADGDVIDMDPTALSVRAVRGVAIVCQVLDWDVDPTVRARQVGDFLSDGDSVRVFFDNDPRDTADDVWGTAVVDQLDTSGITCSGSDVAQELQLDGVTAGSPPDSLLQGAPIRTFTHYEYRLDTWSGDSYLVREDEAGNVDPLVGPLKADDGVAFEYLDSDGNATTDPTAVAQVGVTLRTLSEVRGPDGEQMRDSLQARINTRN